MNEITQALHRSGYLLEVRVCDVLREQFGRTWPNSFYEDPNTKIPRELDFYAERVQRSGPREDDLISSILIVECVNNPHPIAFFVDGKRSKLSTPTPFVITGAPGPPPSAGRTAGDRNAGGLLSLTRFHHYACTSFATQYCTFVQKKAKPFEWMATHLDAIHDCFSKLCAAVDYYTRRQVATSKSTEPSTSLNIRVYYPLLVLQGQLLQVRLNDHVELMETLHIQFQQTAAISGELQPVRIDVVQEKYLADYIATLKLELEKMGRASRAVYTRPCQ